MIEKNLIKRIITSLILLFVLLSMFLSSTMMILSSIIISSITYYEFNRLFYKIFKKKIFKIIFSGIVLLYLFIFVFIIFFIESSSNLESNYKLFLFYSILVSINSDIGGFIIGKFFKGKKLTKISPNKTISGSAGGFMFSLLTVLVFYKDFYFMNINFLIVATLIISFVSQTGDLIISYLKRLAKLKDTGTILPGHGGFLDRIDGILFAVPIGLLLLDKISLIP